MYSSEDLERFYFQYQTEAMPKGISIEQFCSRNKVPYNIFYNWYKDTRNADIVDSNKYWIDKEGITLAATIKNLPLMQ